MKRNLLTRWLIFAAMMIALSMSWSAASMAQIAVGISVRIGPPALPVYEQPICPGAGYLWTPGYWAWSDDDGYYWVPGTWVVAPVGMLWTPGYWGWNAGFYGWHGGYWGPHIGFYGGINYGFGYGGVGFGGGEWRGGAFFYNTAVMRVDTVHVTNVYVNRTVIVNNESHVAFNGGEGGVQARATAQEETYARQPHQAPLAAQTEHEHAASQNRALFASSNHGRPAVAATARPGEFSGHGVVAAKAAGAAYHPPAISPREARAPSTAANNARGTASPNNSTARTSGEKTSGEKNNSGFKPFTPPNKNTGSAGNNRPETASRPNGNRPNESRPNSSRPNEARSNESHPSTPPSSHPANEPRPQTRNNEAAPQHESRPSNPRPESAPPSAPPPHQSAPAPHKESPPPKHESAPREPEKHPGKGR